MKPDDDGDGTGMLVNEVWLEELVQTCMRVDDDDWHGQSMLR